MKQSAIDGLKALDPKIATHWTADGLPRLDMVRTFGKDPTITRADIDEVGTGFTQSNPVLGGTDASVSDATATAPNGTDAPAQPPAGPVVVTPTENPTSAGTEAATDSTQPTADAEQGAEGTTSAKSKLEDLQKDIAEVEENIRKCQAEVAHWNKGVAHYTAALSKLQKQLEVLQPTRTRNPQAIQDYLRAQQKLREQRGELADTLRTLQLNPADIAQKLQAPIDRALKKR